MPAIRVIKGDCRDVLKTLPDESVHCVVTSRNTNGTFRKGTHWRPRKPHWEKSWLESEYINKGRSAGDIAAEVGCTENNILFWLIKHDIPRRSISEVRAANIGARMARLIQCLAR